MRKDATEGSNEGEFANKKKLEECKQKTEDEINTVLTSVFKMHPIVLMQKIDDKKDFSNVADSVIQLSFEDSKKLSKVEDSERQLLNKVLSQHSLGYISQSDVEERAAQFRKQRNKILRMKHAIKDQQLKTIVGRERPETAKAALSSKSICYTANKEILNKR